MKINLLYLLIALPSITWSQAHLFSSKSEVKQAHPEIAMTEDQTESGQNILIAEFELGTFVYFLDVDEICEAVLSIPYDVLNLNTQVEIYNEKYVTISHSEWTAYLQHGIMKIHLQYDSDLESMIFIYTALE